MALTDLMDGRGWCTDLERELDQVFETLAGTRDFMISCALTAAAPLGGDTL
jgi:hypothetical protein